MSNLESTINRWWYEKNKALILLRPLSSLFDTLRKRREQKYRTRAWKAPVPVIVVGNISVGGNGKTPAVISIVERLQTEGFKPAVVSRGYKSKAPAYPFWVTPDSPAKHAGDEPLLIARRCQCPVMIGANRKKSIERLLNEQDINVIVCDDGMQHYQLARDIEIAVVDVKRGFGNEKLLPEGPLREPISRLNSVDFILCNAHSDDAVFQTGTSFLTQLETNKLRSLSDDREIPFVQQEVHAVTGIANPQRFFNTLKDAGYKLVSTQSFDDHHRFEDGDIEATKGFPILMTEKDAVKCKDLNLENAYYLPVTMQVNKLFFERLISALNQASGVS